MDSNTVTTCLKVLSSEMSNENISEDNKKVLQDALSYVMKMYPACNVISFYELFFTTIMSLI